MPRYNGVNHLAMITGDMDATVRFWRDLLGMRLVAGLGRPGYRHYFFEISDTDMIAFFEWPGAEPIPMRDHGFPIKGPAAFDHVSIGVATNDDLLEVHGLLKSAGFDPSPIIDHGFIHSIYAFDPNMIPIEFSCNTAYDPRESPSMTDTEPSETTLEGPNPQSGYWPESEKEGEKRTYPGEGLDLLDPAKNKWSG